MLKGKACISALGFDIDVEFFPYKIDAAESLGRFPVTAFKNTWYVNEAKERMDPAESKVHVICGDPGKGE